MTNKKMRSALSRACIEALENRQLLSVSTTTAISAPSSELLGQTFAVTATVQTADGSPVAGGSVQLDNNGTSTGLTATTNSSGVATFNFGAGNALYTGNYSLAAEFTGDSTNGSSTSATTTLAIAMPIFTTQGDGLQVATVTPGTGTGAVAGDNLTMEYTGFYQSSGAEFDESAAHSPGTFTFTLEADPEQVITGFDEGSVGIEQGETRVLVIPSDLGYQDGQVRVFVIQSVGSGTTAGPAAALSISSAPTTAVVGATITPIEVSVEDASANVVTTDTSSATIAIASGPAGATLGGTTTQTAAAGTVSFNDLTFSEAGTYTLTVTDGSLPAVTTTPITVSAAGLQLVFGTVPASYVTSTVIPPVTVYVEDQSGNIITTDDSEVTLSIGNLQGIGSTLEGTTTVAAVNGVATFSGISIPTVGDYGFGANDPTAEMGASTTFVVTQPPTGVSLNIVTSKVPASVVAGAKLNGAYDSLSFANTGSTLVHEKLTTTLYATADGVVDTSAVAIGKPVTGVVVIPAGRTHPLRIAIPSLPANLPDGNYTILAQTVDNAGDVTTASSGPTVQVAAPFIALSETYSKLTLASSLVAGSKSHASAKLEITNAGNIAADGPSTIALYASQDGLVDSSATLIVSVPKTLRIPVGKTVPEIISIKQIPDVADGNYTIVAQVTDPDGQVTTVNSASFVTIAAPFISLALTPGSITPASLKIGSEATLTVEISNSGNIATTGLATFTVGLSSDGVNIDTPFTPTSQPVSVPAGGMKILHVRFKVPAGTLAGSYFPALTMTQDGQSLSAIETMEISVT